MSNYIVISDNATIIARQIARYTVGMRGLVITQTQYDTLCTFTTGTTTADIAQALDINKHTVVKWLRALGIYDKVQRAVRRHPPAKTRICPRCEILKRCAPRGDGQFCGYCVEEMAILAERRVRNWKAEARLGLIREAA